MNEMTDYTENDIKNYEKETGGNAKWKGNITESFKKWLKGEKVYQYPDKLRVSTYINEFEKQQWEHIMNLEGLPSLSKLMKKIITEYVKKRKTDEITQNKDIYRDLNECISSILLCLENAIKNFPNLKALDHLKIVRTESERMKEITDKFFKLSSNIDKKIQTCDILIVEDHKIHLDLIEDFYIEQGLRVEKAMTANIAEKKLKNIHPKMILMDLGLPDIPGEVMCKKIKQNEDYKDIKIILISAKDVVNINQLVKEVKADDFIPKPVSLKDLEDILRYIDY